MSCCPTCPDDFKVKNVPDEVECLVSNKVKANDLKDSQDYLLIANLRTSFDASYSANPQIIRGEIAELSGSSNAVLFVVDE